MPIRAPEGYLDITNATLRASEIVTTSNVGIANANPTNTLSIGSNVFFEDTSSNTMTVRGNVVTEGIKLGFLQLLPSYDLELTANVGNSISNTVQFTNSTTGFITSSNVGIGTNAPDGLVDVGTVFKVKFGNLGATAADIITGYNSVSITESGGTYTYTRDTAANYGNFLPSTESYSPITGRRYRIKLTARSDYTGSIRLENPANGTVIASYDLTTTFTPYEWEFTATATTMYFRATITTGTTLQFNAFSMEVLEATANTDVIMGGTRFIKAHDASKNFVAIGPSAGATAQGTQAVAVGYLAGQTSQGTQAVAVGYGAGQTSQGATATAVGNTAGETSQGNNATAMGNNAGRYNQGNSAVAVGYQAGQSNQGNQAVAVGRDAGQTSQGINATAVGYAAGQISQGTNAVAVGVSAGQTSQGSYAVAVGLNAGRTSQGDDTTAVGRGAGQFNQGSSAIAVGYQAGLTSQGSSAVAVGYTAGNISQGLYGVAAGNSAGETAQGDNAVAMGNSAGQTSQGANTAAVGREAGRYNQGASATALGYLAGQTSQGANATAVGREAGSNNQGANTVAVGYIAGRYNQGSAAIAVGVNAGATSQGVLATAVGQEAALTNQGNYATAVGYYAGRVSQGIQATAVGTGAGQTSQGTNSVAVGYLAAQYNQSGDATAVGNEAGRYNQGASAVAVGDFTGQSNQGNSAVAVGVNAGNTGQGQYTVAVGRIAGRYNQSYQAIAVGNGAGQTAQGSFAVAVGREAGLTSQGKDAIALGTLAGQYNQPANSFYVSTFSIRNTSGTYAMKYNTSTGEISYTSSDDRVKDGETLITGAVKTLSKLRPQNYFKRTKLDPHAPEQTWATESGLMAQEVYYSAPELRHMVGVPDEAGEIEKYTPPPSDDPAQDPDYSMWGDGIATVDYMQMVPYLVKGVQEIVTELPRSKTTVSNAWGQNITGLIVSANANAHKTNTTPIVALSNVYMDKKWYGVVSYKTTDTNDYDTLIDTKGDTQIWVTDVGGALESGDLVTTSNVAPGYAQKQGDGAIMNYTVAKVTQDCDFTEPTQRPIRVPKKELSNVTYYRHDASYEIDLEKYENVPTFKTRMDETTIYFKEGGSETRYYEGDVEVSEKKYNTLPEDSRSIKHLDEISVDEYEALDDEAKASYALGIKKRYFLLNYSKSKTQIPQHDEEIVVEELVDVLDENGQIVWEETGETEPVYTLVDHGSYKAALVSAKLV